MVAFLRKIKKLKNNENKYNNYFNRKNVVLLVFKMNMKKNWMHYALYRDTYGVSIFKNIPVHTS